MSLPCLWFYFCFCFFLVFFGFFVVFFLGREPAVNNNKYFLCTLPGLLAAFCTARRRQLIVSVGLVRPMRIWALTVVPGWCQGRVDGALVRLCAAKRGYMRGHTKQAGGLFAGQLLLLLLLWSDSVYTDTGKVRLNTNVLARR